MPCPSQLDKTAQLRFKTYNV
ncbi:hypothetical protein DESC_610181 [Desulfosarcina cetonica]|nr:hypothetical protein DESC_610181 [Desulfosarcina cetonica]